ncbi:hypothetical protein [Actinoplanes sp. NPDC020271]|uniref:hypothetical protein n=1 Tax=Actinoplanes sp. NPDC020271 TaxID=3363896 RepID=UPI0037BC07D0
MVIVVGSADDGSTPELAWLLSSSLVHRSDVAVRLLLTASTIDGLPTLRAAFTSLRADVRPLAIG